MAAVAAAAGAAAIEVGVQGLKANPGGLNTYGFLRLLRRRLYNTAVPVSGVYAVAIADSRAVGRYLDSHVESMLLGVSGAVVLFVCTFEAAAWIVTVIQQNGYIQVDLFAPAPAY